MSDVNAANRTDVLLALGFQRLGHNMHLYKPAGKSERTDLEKVPSLIVFCAWMSAQPKHIAKYLVAHQTTYPDAQILLIQNEMANMIWRPDSGQMTAMAPAATAIKAYLTSTSNPAILFHVFSNGGCHSAVQLEQSCRETCGGLRIPIAAIVFDSCPAIPNVKTTVQALCLGLPKNPLVHFTGTVVGYTVIGTCALLYHLGLQELAADKLWRALKNPDRPFLLAKDGHPVPRTYIYSKTDTMIPYQEVLQHAKDTQAVLSQRKNFDEKTVQIVEFVGTQHVNHVKDEKDKVRYWQAVQETWERANLYST